MTTLVAARRFPSSTTLAQRASVASAPSTVKSAAKASPRTADTASGFERGTPSPRAWAAFAGGKTSTDRLRTTVPHQGNGTRGLDNNSGAKDAKRPAGTFGSQHEGRPEPGGSNSDVAQYLSNGRKPFRDGHSGPSSNLHTSAGDIHVDAARISGRWADTFQGGRINNRDGGRMNDPSNVKGGRNGQTSNDLDPCDEGLKVGGAIGATFAAASAMSGPGAAVAAPIAVATLSATAAWYGACRIGEAYDKQKNATPPAGNGGAKDPNPIDDDTSGGGAPVPGPRETVGQAAGRQVIGRGTQGSPDDGRGNNEGSGSGNSQQNDRALSTQGAAGSREAKTSGGAVSMEEMLYQATFTDPTVG